MSGVTIYVSVEGYEEAEKMVEVETGDCHVSMELMDIVLEPMIDMNSK